MSYIPGAYANWNLLIQDFQRRFGRPPSDFISSPHHENGYHFMSGTSMASPHVAGVAALLLSVNPNLTPLQLRNTILNNTDSCTIQIPNPVGGSVFENQTVYRLNAFKAVSSVAFTSSAATKGISITGLRSGFTLQNNTSLVLPDTFTSLDYMVTTANQTISYTNGVSAERSLDVNLIAGVTYTLQFDYTNLTANTALANISTMIGVGASTFTTDLQVTQNYPNVAAGRRTITFTPTASQLTSSNKLWVRFIRTNTQQTVSVTVSNIMLRADYQVTAIGNSAFANKTQLSQIAIPASATRYNSYPENAGNSV